MSKRDVKIRFEEHIKYALSEHDIRNDYFMPLMNAIRKYGKDSFVLSLIEQKEYDKFNDAEINEGNLIKINRSFLSENGYNINYREKDGQRYYVEEIREKIIRNNTGENNPFYNRTHTKEVRKILSDKAKERLATPENNPRYGYRYTEEDKIKSRKSKEKYGRPFYAEGTLYKTLYEASIKYDLTKQAIKYRIESSNYKDWYYK